MHSIDSGLLYDTMRAPSVPSTNLVRSYGAVAMFLVGTGLFGAALGAYAIDGRQVLSSALKMPILLAGTATISFPSWYLMQFALLERPLSLPDAFRIQFTSLLATAAVWAALAPPLFLLIAGSDDYLIARALAVFVAGFGGCVGLVRFTTLAGGLKRTLLLYLIVFGAVGGQLAWFLRPFIGSPYEPFRLLRILGA